MCWITTTAGQRAVTMEDGAPTPLSRSSIRRSVSSMSSTSSPSLWSLPLAPVWRTDSFGEAHESMKRVPSFSVAAKDSDVGSDEEENLRTKQTKKAWRGTDHRVNKLLSSQDESPACRPRMNLQRNPSILGPELPHNSPSTYPVSSHPLYSECLVVVITFK